ncbi:MAG: Na+/H+ antiporter subunit E [Pseudomonadota bacterium]
MLYLFGLIAGLVTFWLSLSGHYTPLLLALGAVSVALAVILSARLGIIDREGAPYFAGIGLLLYLPWLIWEIIKSNITVIRACLRADMDINPALVKVKTVCESDLAKVLFANSITLTPGTVTISVERDRLLVHALYEDTAQPEAFAEMDRRSRRAVDGAGKST